MCLFRYLWQSRIKNIRVIDLAHQVPSSQCPTAIKLQTKWRNLWTSHRIFTWFTHAFLNNDHRHAINQAGSYYVITLYGIEASYIPLLG